MACTIPYVKAEVLEVLEADEGDNEAEPESPLSPSSTGSEDDSDSLIESPRKKRKLSESPVVSQTTSKETSTNPVANGATTPLVAARLARARRVDRPLVELTEATRQANVRALMDPSDKREPDKFLLSDDFEVRMELWFDESAMSESSMSSTGNRENLMLMYLSTQ